MQLDHRIGRLNSGKFYAFVNGHRGEPTVGTLEEVERALGIRESVPATPRPALKSFRGRRTYTVQVMPGVVSWSVQPYSVDFEATDRDDAIRQARAEYNENVAWTNGAGKFTARLKKEQ